MKKIALVITVVAVVAVGWHWLYHSPSYRGVVGGKLAPCPDAPNCVNSQSDDSRHQIAPIVYTGSGHPFTLLRPIIRNWPRAKIVKEEGDYLYARFRSELFSFVDDVEFYYDPASGVIHVRSGSRLGYGDRGVNRERVEKLRALLEGGSA